MPICAFVGQAAGGSDGHIMGGNGRELTFTLSIDLGR